MNADDMTVGQRVRLIHDIYDEPENPGKVIDTIYQGREGTVIAVFPEADNEMGEEFAHVKFDEPFSGLEEWDNVLHVWRDDGDVLPADFEAIA